MGIQTINSDAAQPDGVLGNESFESFVSDLPGTETGFGVVNPGDVDGGDTGEGFDIAGEPSPAEKRKMTLKMTKQMKKAMQKLKENIATFPKMYFGSKAKQHPEWALDKDEEELITDSITFALDILDIDFEIEALHITLRSIWWVIMYPVSVIGMIFITHQTAVKAAHPEDFPENDDDAK